MRRLNLFVLLLFLVPTTNAWSQEVTGNLQGRVLGGDGASLPAASVTVLGPSLLQPRGALSGDDGNCGTRLFPTGLTRDQVYVGPLDI